MSYNIVKKLLIISVCLLQASLPSGIPLSIHNIYSLTVHPNTSSFLLLLLYKIQLFPKFIYLKSLQHLYTENIFDFWDPQIRDGPKIKLVASYVWVPFKNQPEISQKVVSVLWVSATSDLF